jgi:hypothetical protein
MPGGRYGSKKAVLSLGRTEDRNWMHIQAAKLYVIRNYYAFGESLFLRKLILGIQAQVRGKSLTGLIIICDALIRPAISPVKLLPRTWAWMPKMSFRKNRDSPNA